MTTGRGASPQANRHSLPSRRDQPDQFDSQSRYGRRDEAIERGRDKAWDDELADGSGSGERRKVTKADRETSNLGVWTAALFMGLLALLSVLWVASAGLVASLGEKPSLYGQLAAYLTAGLGYLGILGSLHSVWLLSLAPRVRDQRTAIRRNAVVLVCLGVPFLHDVVTGDATSHGAILIRLSAAAPILFLAVLGSTIARVGAGNHDTHWGSRAALLWCIAAVLVAFAGTWFWTAVAVATCAAVCTMLAGNGAWNHYENRLWGVATAPKSAASSSKSGRSKGRSTRR